MTASTETSHVVRRRSVVATACHSTTIMNKTLCIAFFCLAATVTHSFAQRAYTPAAGSPERKAIMDVLRVPVEADLRQKVIFKVQHLRIVGTWALARVVPLRPDGSDIDYSRTRYRDDLAEGAFDGEGEALLRNDGSRWRLLEWRFGASDTEVPMWLQTYGAPAALNQ